jgi:hypothetical protein
VVENERDSLIMSQFKKYNDNIKRLPSIDKIPKVINGDGQD